MARTLPIELLSPDVATVAEAAVAVRMGGVIVYPTETLYGIGADGLNEAAVRRVLAAKRRRDNKPLLLIIDSPEMLRRVVGRIASTAEKLMERFWPGPLTLIFEASAGVPPSVTQGSGTVGVRIPASAVCHKLLQCAAGPLVSTSANLSGEPAPRTVAEIRAQLLEGVEIFLDAGALPESKPSTIVNVTSATPTLIRDGAISLEQLRQVVPDVQR